MCCTYPHTNPRGISTQTRMFSWERLHVSLRSGIKRRKDPFGAFGWGRRRVGLCGAAQPQSRGEDRSGGPLKQQQSSSKAAMRYAITTHLNLDKLQGQARSAAYLQIMEESFKFYPGASRMCSCIRFPSHASLHFLLPLPLPPHRCCRTGHAPSS